MTTAYAKLAILNLNSINKINVYKEEILSKFLNFAYAKVQ